MVAGPAPPEVGVKVNVAADPVLPATRSTAETLNVTSVTVPPIAPDDTVFETPSSLVKTDIVPPAVGVLPMLNPVSVMVTAVPLPMFELDFVSTTDVCPGAAELHAA